MIEASKDVRLDTRPRYMQAVDALRRLLDEAQYEVGDVLPPADELAKQLGVSRLTLREAMAYLEKDGRVCRRQGVGTFVTEPAGAHIRCGLEQLSDARKLAGAAGLEAKIADRRIESVLATPEWARLLEVEPGEELVRIRAVISVGADRIAYFDSLVPASRIDVTALVSRDLTMLEYLMESGEPALAYTRSDLQAINADGELAARLDIGEGEAVLSMFEIYHSRDDHVVALSRNFLRTSCCEYRIVRRVAQ